MLAGHLELNGAATARKIAGAWNLWDCFRAVVTAEERADLSIGRHVGSPRSLRVALALLVIACTSRAAVAQDSWVYTSEIPCAAAPVYGVTFNQCFASNTRSFRVGNVQSWRLVFTEPKSEVAVGLYRLVEAHGVGGMSPVGGSSMAEWLRTADALKNVTTGASAWSWTGGDYVTFSKAQRQCIGFVRNGPISGGVMNWVLGAVFCRNSPSPIPTAEAQFIADAVRVR